MPEPVDRPQAQALRIVADPLLASGPEGRDLDAAAERIVARWNERMPRNRVRIINRNRRLVIRLVLKELTEAELCQAIDYYSYQEWQRRHAAWKTLDSFLDPTTVAVQWYERAVEAAERADAARRPPVAVSALVSEVAQALAASDERARRRWECLGRDDKIIRWRQAQAQLPPGSPQAAIMRRVLEQMIAEATR